MLRVRCLLRVDSFRGLRRQLDSEVFSLASTVAAEAPANRGSCAAARDSIARRLRSVLLSQAPFLRGNMISVAAEHRQVNARMDSCRRIKQILSLTFRRAEQQRNAWLAAAALDTLVSLQHWLREQGVSSADPMWLQMARNSNASRRRMHAVPTDKDVDSGEELYPDELQRSIDALCHRLGDSSGATATSSSSLAAIDEIHSGLQRGAHRRRAISTATLEGDGQRQLSLSTSATASIATQRSDGGSSTVERLAVTADALRERRNRSSSMTPNESFLRYCLQQHLCARDDEVPLLVSALRRRPSTALRLHATSPFAPVALRTFSTLTGYAEAPAWLPSAWRALTFVQQPEALSYAQQAHMRGVTQQFLRNKVCSMQSLSSLLPIVVLDGVVGLSSPSRSPSEGTASRGQLSILDMCAAPGSKTMQLLDALVPCGHPTRHLPLLVCNDVHVSRAADLAKRLASLHPAVVTTSVAGDRLAQSCRSGSVGNFDAVLIDAPCSAEGRMHLEPQSWRLWHPSKGIAFHRRQLSLLMAAIEATTPGGVVVYSTCTMNPLENEAVAAAAVSSGVVEAIPLPKALTHGLGGGTSHRGVAHWNVPTPSGGYSGSPSVGGAAEESNSRVPETCWSTAYSEEVRGAVAKSSLRVFPHTSGGMEAFYVIALRRVRPTLSSASNPLALPWIPLDTYSRRPTDAAPPAHQRVSTVTELRSVSLLERSLFSAVSHSHGRLLRLLRPFFLCESDEGGASTTSRGVVEGVLRRHRLRFLQSDRSADLHAVTEDALEFLCNTQCSAEDGSSTLDAGVCLFRGADDALTEAGARLLVEEMACPLQTFALPLDELVVLLSHQRLEVPTGDRFAAARAAAMPAKASSVQASAARVFSANGGSDTCQDLQQWFDALTSSMSTIASGNAVAIVTLTQPSPRNTSGAPAVAAKWYAPVRIVRDNFHGSGNPRVSIVLLLSTEERRRAQEMVAQVRAVARSARSSRSTPDVLVDGSPLSATETARGGASGIELRERLLWSAANRNHGATSDGTLVAFSARGPPFSGDSTVGRRPSRALHAVPDRADDDAVGLL